MSECLWSLSVYRPESAGSPEPEAIGDEACVEGDDEVIEEAMQLEGAIAQCLYLRYSLDLDYRSVDWGGNSAVRTSCHEVALQQHV